jgi:hypothetical protein
MVARLILVQKIVVRIHVGKLDFATSVLVLILIWLPGWVGRERHVYNKDISLHLAALLTQF